MTTTVTTIKEPVNLAPKVKMAIYQVAFKTTYVTGGEPIDLTDDFDFVYSVTAGGNDTLADNGYQFTGICPAPTVAVSSTNVLIDVHWGGTSDAVMEEFTNGGDLTAVGQLSIVVLGS